jgi:hypothetical protein
MAAASEVYKLNHASRQIIVSLWGEKMGAKGRGTAEMGKKKKSRQKKKKSPINNLS